MEKVIRIKYLRPALPLCFFFIGINANAQLWKQYADSAKVYNDEGYTDTAIVYYNKAEKILKKDSVMTASLARIMNLSGNAYYNIGDYEKGRSYYLEAKRIREAVLGKLHPDYSKTLNNLGNLYEETGEYEKGVSVHFEAKQLREKIFGKQHADYATSCNSLGNMYMHLGQFEKAEQLYLEAMHIRENVVGKEHNDYAISCDNLGSLYMQMGQYSKAESLYLESIRITEKLQGKENTDYAISINNLGILYKNKGEFEKAETVLLETKNIFERVTGKEHASYGASCTNLGILYYDMGQYDKAEALYLEDKKITEKLFGKDNISYGKSCTNLGNLYSTTGQFQKAELSYNEARQIQESLIGRETIDYSTTTNALGSLYFKLGQYDKSKTLYEEAKQIQEKIFGKLTPEFAGSCNNLGQVYLAKKQYKKAEILFLEGKKIREKLLGKEHADYIESCSSLAGLYGQTGDFKKANALYKEAFYNYYTGVKKVFQFTTEKEQQAYIKGFSELGREYLWFATRSSSSFDFAYDVSIIMRNLILSSSQQLRHVINNSNNAAAKKLYSDWVNVREQLAFWYGKPLAERGRQTNLLEVKAGNLEKELARHFAAFKEVRQPKNISWKEIQQKLHPNEATIEFAEFRLNNGTKLIDSVFYIALILRKDKPTPQLVTLFEKKQLDNLLAVSGKNIASLYTRGAGEDEYNNAATNSVFQLIWKPLEKHLTGIKKVYFSPAGLLHRISFAALPVNSKMVLSDKIQLIQLNTTASVVMQSSYSITTANKIALFGGIKYNADSNVIKNSIVANVAGYNNTRSIPEDITRNNIWQELAGTQVEINEIKKEAASRYAVTVLSGVNATEESIKALNGKASPTVLHIATHGFFFSGNTDLQNDLEKNGNAFKQSDDPLMRSGLLFAGANNAWKGIAVEGIEDGILTSYEVSNMYLPNTKLVVLSACETGLGDIQGSEGVYGLQRAFKMAGAENLIMSLWKVPDTETAEFMQQLYKNLFAKQSITDAFYNTQTTMKNKYRKEPYKWAAWIMIR